MPESCRSRLARWGFNFFPTYRSTGAWITYIADDFREIRIRLPLGWRTRNYVGTMFGGSMYAAGDGIFMVMLIKALGPDYIVWDKSATVRFRKPARTTLYASFVLTSDDLGSIRAGTAGGEAIERVHRIALVDRQSVVHAEIEWTIYIRRRDSRRAPRPHREPHHPARLIMRRFSLVLLIALASPLAAQTGRHTITHEDVFLMKRVAGPVISPDGRWIVFSVSEPSYTEGEQVTDLWLVPTDGSAQPRRLTNTKGGESGVEWSPDGRRIAFSARREGDDASQIYLLDLSSGGEAQRVTNLATGASSPQWRPDGRALLFASMVYPGATSDSANRAAIAERKARKYNARVFDASPIRLWDHWLDDRRPHLFVQSLDPGAPARDLLAGSQLVQGTGFGGQLGN